MNGTREDRPLAALVRERNEQWSYREMADRARRAGHSISHSQLADYGADHVAKPPHGEQVHALADALGLTVEDVLRAIFEQFYGYKAREVRRARPGVSRVAAAVPSDLTPDAEAELTRLITAWVASRQAEDSAR